MFAPQHSNMCSGFVLVEPNFHWNAVRCYIFNFIDLKIGINGFFDILHLFTNFQVDLIKNAATRRILVQAHSHEYAENGFYSKV